MQKVINTYKKLGETPLECLERIRIEYGIDIKVPMTYAGRLDPLAEGELIILIGDECKNKEKYLGLDKEYEIEILFGISTDTHDVLGMIDEIKVNELAEVSLFDDFERIRQGEGGEKNLRRQAILNLNKYIGKFIQEYPRYSSRIIAMKEIPEEMPTKEVEIYSIEDLGMSEMNGNEILRKVTDNIALVKGDFRQKDILNKWNDVIFDELREKKFPILKIKVKCSSGTYMRSLASKIGKDLGVGALAFSIKRTRVFS